jgi:hypothetical protein
MRIMQYWKDLFQLPTNVRSVMATIEEVQAQVTEANEATDNIANDLSGLKGKLDQAIADTQGQVDAAVSDALQQVSDGMAPLVSKLQGVASSTPDEPNTDDGVDV